MIEHGIEHGLDAWCLAIRQTTASDRLHDVLDRCEPHLFPIRESLVEGLPRSGGVRVGGVLGEDGGDEFGRRVTGRAEQARTIDLVKDIGDRLDPGSIRDRSARQHGG